MTKETDMTDERKIVLSIEDELVTPDWSGLPGWDGYSVPEGTDTSNAPMKPYPVTVTVETDSDSSFTPSQWVWLMFFADEEPWFRFTYGEAVQLRDKLSEAVEWYEKLSPEDQAKVNGKED